MNEKKIENARKKIIEEQRAFNELKIREHFAEKTREEKKALIEHLMKKNLRIQLSPKKITQDELDLTENLRKDNQDEKELTEHKIKKQNFQKKLTEDERALSEHELREKLPKKSTGITVTNPDEIAMLSKLYERLLAELKEKQN